MKEFMLTLGMFMIFFSCSKDKSEDDNNLSAVDMMNEVEVMILVGEFMNEGEYQTSGMVAVDEDRAKLTFTDFMTEEGPALEVWLATQIAPQTEEDFISLGELQGLSGNFEYELPEDVDYSDFNHVLIWCVEFTAPFGSARIQ